MPQVTASAIKIGETPAVRSSTVEVNYQRVSEIENVADLISIVMSRSYVEEMREDEGERWRFASTERIEELLALGKPDEDGNLYYKIVREGEERGIYLVSLNEWRIIAPEKTLILNELSIRNAIREKRPLIASFDLVDGLVVFTNYRAGDTALVAQLETKPLIVDLLRVGKGQTGS